MKNQPHLNDGLWPAYLAMMEQIEMKFQKPPLEAEKREAPGDGEKNSPTVPIPVET